MLVGRTTLSLLIAISCAFISCAASIMLSVPIMLVLVASSGYCSQYETCFSAAVCIIRSGVHLRHINRMACASLMSPRQYIRRLSVMVVCRVRSDSSVCVSAIIVSMGVVSRFVIYCVPRNPAPPVISARFIVNLLSLWFYDHI